MIITTFYTVEHSTDGQSYIIKNKDAPICPDCGQLLSGYDRRRRHVIDDSGRVFWFWLRRLKCHHCNKLHIELPDFMAPNKHYNARLIEDVKTGRSNFCPADDSTIRRWKKKLPPSLPLNIKKTPLILKLCSKKKEVIS
jgi:hypothetical protein